MGDLLKQAFREASRLSEKEQEALARWILEEIAADRSWQDLMEGSADDLSDLAAEAVAEHRSGKTQKLDPGGL